MGCCTEGSSLVYVLLPQDDLERFDQTGGGKARQMAVAHRGDAFGRMGYHKLAFKDFNRALSLDGSLWIVHLHSGMLHERKLSFSKAHKEYSRVIELNDRCAIAYAARGRIRAKFGEEETALEDFDRAIELDPKLAVAYFNRGLTHMKLGHVERALGDQRMAARLGWKAARDFLSAKGIKW